MRQVVYREWVPAGLLVKILVGFVSLLTLCILLILVATGYVFQNLFWIAVPTSVLAFLALLLWNYKGIKIQLNTEELLVNYGILNRKSITLEDIVSCEPTKTSFRRYGGVGVRLGTDGSWAYTTSFGDAVKIILRRGRPFVFSSNNPEKICAIISQTKNVQ
jgi:uncharacterized membrane protein YdbT with pleckstrin-like domain